MTWFNRFTCLLIVLLLSGLSHCDDLGESLLISESVTASGLAEGAIASNAQNDDKRAAPQPLPMDLSLVPPETFPPIIWFAPFLSGGGYCTEATAFVLSLLPHVVSGDIAISQHGDAFNSKYVQGWNAQTRDAMAFMWSNVVRPSEAVVICHSEPGAWALPTALYQTSKCPPKQARVRIGRTMFETDRIPDGWAARLNAMDYVWLPTAFHQRIFIAGGVRADKVRVIPEAVDTAFYDRNTVTEAFEYVDGERRNGRPRAFRFLSVFKWEERKGADLLIDAFSREFNGRSDRAELWILTSAFHSDTTTLADVIANIAASSAADRGDDANYAIPPIRLLPFGIDQSRMPAVYAAADCFVLPSRGEGWGRPHVEAMSVGLPVIATNWSGPTQFMTEENSFPLKIDGLETIKDGPFAGHKWASPSTTHLMQLMRHVYTHPDDASKKGQRARQTMEREYCLECVARVVLQELSALNIRKRTRSVAAIN